jgi:hypothetical protein
VKSGSGKEFDPMKPRFGKRILYAFRAFFSILFHGRIAGDILAEVEATSPAATRAASPAPGLAHQAAPRRAAAEPIPGRAVQVLALLQRDGRLIDFFREDISAYDDGQVGAAVRELHASCRETLGRYLTLEPVFDEEEGCLVTVPSGFDPAEVKLLGNVTGTGPFRGVLRHRGWRVAAATLPPVPDGARPIIAPAEVEIE